MDPYEVLNLPLNAARTRACTVEQVRYNYKQLARQLHPDKRGPDVTQEDATYVFQVLTDAYKRVVADFELCRLDRMHDELKQGSQEAAAAAAATRPASFASNGGPQGGRAFKFSIAKFNRVFEDVRERPVDDRGYGDWMARNPASREQAEREERARLRKQMAIQKYRDPEPTPLGRSQIAFTELGRTRVKDYGGNGFSDYRIAHTTTRLADEQAKIEADMRKVSFDAFSKAREKADYTMTEEDHRAERWRQAERERFEQRRQRALSQQDRAMTEQFERANRLLLN